MNNNSSYFWTSECVGPGHPDKVADQISDAVLDECLLIDSRAKVACEVMVKDNIVILGGEVSFNGNVQPNFEKTIRNAISKIGYTDSELGFSYDNFRFINFLSKQSLEINTAVSDNDHAGDQGFVVGYASNETPSYMPLTIYLARKLVEAMEHYRQSEGAFTYPDCKTQITVEYDRETKTPIRVSHAVVSVHHSKKVRLNKVRSTVLNHVIQDIFMNSLPSNLKSLFNKGTKYIINHAGEWTIGGPVADCGVTNRKLVVDAYGADCEIGGGGHFGKDGTKVDRSAAYMARYVAKNVVASGLASKAKVQISYVIGARDPISFTVNTLGTGTIPDEKIEKKILNMVSLRPYDIIEKLELRTPFFFKTSNKGQYGVDETFPWEQLDLVSSLKH